jgi:hypothetical protein
VIDCPEDLKVDYDSDLGDEVDTDGPNIVASRDGELLFTKTSCQAKYFSVSMFALMLLPKNLIEYSGDPNNRQVHFLNGQFRQALGNLIVDHLNTDHVNRTTIECITALHPSIIGLELNGSTTFFFQFNIQTCNQIP